MELLPIDWYFTPPIDFEHKEYILYAYLLQVDKSFHERKLSPHLLHIEKLINELSLFKGNLDVVIAGFDKRRYKYFDNPLLENTKDESLDIIVDIVDFSIPQFNSRLSYGQKLFEKYNQILY